MSQASLEGGNRWVRMYVHPTHRNTIFFLIIVVILVFIRCKFMHFLDEYYLFPPRGGFNHMLFHARIRCVHSDVHWHGMLSDKYMVKKIAMELNIHGLHVPRTFQIVEHCSDLDYNKLPEHFVMKPTHFSGVVHLCKKCKNTREECDNKIRRTLQTSWNTWYRRLLHRVIPIVEHHYDYITPKIIVEEFVENNDDWKFHVMNGKVIFALYCTNRKEHSHERCAITREYIKLPWKRYGKKLTADLPCKPNKWEDMVRISEELGRRLMEDEYARIDLYVSNNKIYLGEITITPEGARGRFDPWTIDIDIIQNKI